MRVAYGRVSTASGEQASALRAQLEWLKAQEPALVLQDVESGMNTTRAGYLELLGLVEAGRVTELLATRSDRLGRDAQELVRLVQLCDAKGAAVRTRDDGRLSARTAEELIMLYLKAAMGQAESMRLSLRVHAGLGQGRAMGKPMRKPCWGYRLSDDRLRLELKEPDATIAREFLDALKASGWRMLPTLKANPLVPFGSVRGVRAWLLNPTIRGAIGYRQLANHKFEQILWDQHDALITPDEFGEMERAIARNRKLWGVHGQKTVRALTGLCICSECKNRLKYIGGRTVPSLKCSGDLCSQHYKGVREEVVLRWVTGELPKVAAGKLAAMVEQSEPVEVALLRQRIDELEALHDQELQPVIDAKRQRLEQLLVTPNIDADLLQRISNPAWFDTLTYEELTVLLHRLVGRILITKQVPIALSLQT
jgi:DNA invertase Pin-like site-specific DNA recombinase